MRKIILSILGLLSIFLGTRSFALDIGKEYFVRTALHVVRGDEIYWVNYNDPAKTILIPTGEKVMIKTLEKHLIQFDWNGKVYNFAYTQKGNIGTEEIFDKFFTIKDINSDINKYPEDIKSKVKRGIAEKGMTKEQILSAVGVPAIIEGNQKTFNLTLKEVMASDTWIFFYNRFNKWQIRFNNGIASAIDN